MAECEMVAFMQIGYPDPSGKKAKWHYDKKEKSEIFFEMQKDKLSKGMRIGQQR